MANEEDLSDAGSSMDQVTYLIHTESSVADELPLQQLGDQEEEDRGEEVAINTNSWMYRLGEIKYKNYYMVDERNVYLRNITYKQSQKT